MIHRGIHVIQSNDITLPNNDIHCQDSNNNNNNNNNNGDILCDHSIVE